MKISLTKKLLSRTKNHIICQTVVPLVVQTDQLLIQRKVSMDFQVYQKKKWGTCGWRKLIENYFQKNYLSAHATLNLNICKGSQAKV